MLRLEPRPEASEAMRYASPAIAVALTLACGMIVFAILGKNPAEGFKVFFLNPIRDLDAIAELLLKATPLMLIAVGLAVGFRANVWNIGAEGQFLTGAVGATGIALAFKETHAALLLPSMVVAGAIGRGAVGGNPGAAQDPVQCQRDPHVADAGVHRAADGFVAGVRTVEGSGGLQFSADRDVRGCRAAADADRRHAAQLGLRHRGGGARRRLHLHGEELHRIQDARRRRVGGGRALRGVFGGRHDLARIARRRRRCRHRRHGRGVRSRRAVDRQALQRLRLRRDHRRVRRTAESGRYLLRQPADGAALHRRRAGAAVP